MAKLSHTVAAAMVLAATLAGCGQGAVTAPRTAQAAAAARVAAQGADLAAVRREIKDHIEDDTGADTWYEVRRVDAKATEQRGVFAFKAYADKIHDGDRIAVLIHGTYNAKTQELESEEEEQ